jgi:transposase-like protein
MARKKGSTDYPVGMKREAIRLFFEEGWTKAEITAHLAIRDPERVGNWLWRYRKEGEAMFSTKRSGRPPKEESQEAYIARLEMENDLLKKYHTELREVLRERRNIGASNTNSDDMK